MFRLFMLQSTNTLTQSKVNLSNENLPVRHIFQITDKHFVADSHIQKIVIQFTNLGERTIKITRALYSDTGFGLSASSLLSTYRKAERGRLIIPFSEDNSIIKPGQSFNIELELGQIWKAQDINRWSGKWGYLRIYISYEDSTEEIEEFYSI